MGAGVAMDRFDEPAVFYAQVRLCVCMREREREREKAEGVREGNLSSWRP
jgi:hypothetical protein